MKYGFIKVAAITPRVEVADCPYNARTIAQGMEQAYQAGAQVVVFPELSLTGYTCGDLFLQENLLTGARMALEDLVEKSKECAGLLSFVGLPVLFEQKLYNCAAVIQDGRILAFVPKKHLPNYSEFYEQRHFTPAPEENRRIRWEGREIPFGNHLLFECANQPALVVGVEICEDLWVVSPPSIGLAMAGATLIVNLSASDETIGKAEYRRSLVEGQSARLLCGYVYCDAGDGESTTDMVFAGHNLIAENGRVLAESEPFQNSMIVTEIDVERMLYDRRRMSTWISQTDGYERVAFELKETAVRLTRDISKYPFVPQAEERLEMILSMQANGLKKRLSHVHADHAVIGISGGLDSTLALLVAVRAADQLAWDRKRVLGITMPCFGTTHRTRSNAELLCDRLDIECRRIDIAESVRVHFQAIAHDEEEHNVVFENAQARERTQILMDVANGCNGLVVGTGDLSELALGWATYNGDHMSMYGVNASVPKTLVRYLVQHEARRTKDASLRDVLLDILDTPVSPELLPPKDGEIAQKTEDLVGPYALHDFFLYYCIRWGCTPEKIEYLAQYAFQGEYEPDCIHHWLETFYRRFFQQQFKRSCLPDGPKIGSVALSPRGDWRMPSDASQTLWRLK